MRQLTLPSSNIVSHQLDQALRRFDLERALELLVELASLTPDQPVYPAARAAVATLIERFGRRFPTHPKKAEVVAAAWEEATAHLSAAGLDWTVDPLDRLARAYYHRMGELLDRVDVGYILGETPAGWYHLEAGNLEAAIRSLEATTEGQPAGAAFWRDLANARFLAGDVEGGRAAALRALLAGPLAVGLESFRDPEVAGLLEEVEALGLAGDPRSWAAAVGLCTDVFAWDQAPDAPVWDPTGTPLGVSGQAGAFLTFLRLLERQRKAPAGPNWQVAEARRQLRQLAPGLYELYQAGRAGR